MREGRGGEGEEGGTTVQHTNIAYIHRTFSECVCVSAGACGCVSVCVCVGVCMCTLAALSVSATAMHLRPCRTSSTKASDFKRSLKHTREAVTGVSASSQ